MANTESLFRLDGKVALVTGSTRGLGAMCAELMANVGAKVMVTGRVESDGLAVVEKIQSAGGQAAFRRLEVTSEDDWQAVIAATIGTLGGLDVIVNNAGVELFKPLLETSLEDFRNVMTINVDGVFLGTKLGVAAMRPGGAAGAGGSIINMSSVAGLIGFPLETAYCASKGAVRLLTKAAALECAKAGLGVRINSVHPGVVKTPMLAHSLQPLIDAGVGSSPEEVSAYVTSLHPIGRLGEPMDIATGILFLASEASSWMTGSEIVIDGGFVAQ
jgi:NAD(P)-dependent dehydrogenase (short-subunit alcohol dehydrogenase family)